MTIYTVQPGDSVYTIARGHRVPPERIIVQNGLSNPAKLTPGQALVIQYPKQLYTVQRGDTLGDIAVKFGTTVNTLWQNNPQLGGNDRIYPGQGLIISYVQEKIGKLAVNGYAYPNINRQVLRQTLPYLTYLSVFSYGFQPGGQLLTQNDREIIATAHEYGVKPLMVLTTINAQGQFSSQLAHELLNNPTEQNLLAETLRRELTGRGYAGVDVDFEYIPQDDANAYSEFINRLRQDLAPSGLSVMTALAPKTSADQKGLLYEAHDYSALGRASRDVLLMTYEWGYSRSEPMAVAPIDKVEQVLRFATSVIPPERIFMGVPNYGYDWTLPYVAGQSVARAISNVQAIDQAIQAGAFIQYDETAQTPYYNYWRGNAEHEVWFEDARSIRAKLLLANEYRLRGISVWNIMQYFPQLWMVLNALFEIEKLA